MKVFYNICFAILLLANHSKAFSPTRNSEIQEAEYLHRAIKAVTDVMVYDIYSPPVTSRTYAYISVAAYEILRQNNPKYLSLAGQLHGLTPIPAPAAPLKYNLTLSAVHAVLTAGKTFVISEEKLEAFEQIILNEIKQNGISEDIYQNSLDYGQLVADHILKWAQQDRYKETRALGNYQVKNDAASWKPTPPAYIKAIEPNWNKIRPFLLDSAAQFKPQEPPVFSTDSTSEFFKEVLTVYSQVNSNTTEQIDIAKFWDCNPFQMNIRGHVMYATKKISPNGHWMNITGLVCRKTGTNAVKSAEAYAFLAITLADCFISCWDEKYRSIVIRPETFINKYINPNWVPVLQTPPFPEYTSGHSVVSSGAAIILTQLFGDQFEFADDSEVEFGLPIRNFKSFREAADEAAISRLYGGIHYMPAIKNGQQEGFAIGAFFVDKLNIRSHLEK